MEVEAFEEACRAEGLSKGQIRQARNSLGVEAKHGSRFDGKWVVQLPG
jgi:hypothetical protein